MARYLTPETKEHELKLWRDTVRTAPRTGPLLPGGSGGVDAEIVPYCTRINNVPGVVTLQSCAGHLQDRTHHTAGQLWIAFSKPMAHAAYIGLPVLALHPRVDRLSFIWVGGREIFDITFDGLNRYDNLDVVDSICASLNNWCTSLPDPWS